MTKFYKKIATLIASSAMILNLAAPAFAATTLEISGNGADSVNATELTQVTTTNVVQSNNAQISNNVEVKADSGDNEANENTNGDVSIETGDADVSVDVTNSANTNVANLENCGNCAQDIDVLISGNGADTENSVGLSQVNTNLVVQSNNADIDNHVDADAETGDNEANENTGGDVSIETGDASTTVEVSTEANANAARIGGSGDGSSLSARILGNGADSDNSIDLALVHVLDAVQSNVADVYNHIDADADSGDNEANENTGGDVSIGTGDATVLADVDTATNFNAIDLGCDCFIEDILAKIADNGTDSENALAAELVDSLGIFQSNCSPLTGSVDSLSNIEPNGDCDTDNRVDAEAVTGENEAKENTGDSEGGDPSVETGDADATVELNNVGNINTVDSGASDDVDETDDDINDPVGGSGFKFDFHFDLSGLFN